MNINKALLLLLGALLAFWGISYWMQWGNSADSNFRREFPPINTQKITDIELTPATTRQKLHLQRHENSWSIVQPDGNTLAVADSFLVLRMLKTLAELKPEQLVAKDPKQWEAYKVTDSDATRLVVAEGNKTILDLYIGKFDAQNNQQPSAAVQAARQPDITTYVRLAGENEIYAVQGLLQLIFNRKEEDFLPKPSTPAPTDSLTSPQH